MSTQLGNASERARLAPQGLSMATDAGDASRTRCSVFSLDEFEELVSAALGINSDRFPDGALALAFGNPESSSSCPFLSNENNNKVLSTSIYSPLTPGATQAHRSQRHPPPHDMHPPLDSIDFGRASCVPGLGCAQGTFGQARGGSVPTITLTTPSSPSKSRLVLNKIRKGASAFVARTRTLSTPVRRVTLATPDRRPPPLPASVQFILNPRNPDYRPIPTVSISATYKNNLQLRSTVSLVDLETFNNNSAYSLATNTADFYDDESDFVPYLPLACQFERAVLKSPSMPSLPSRPATAERAVTISTQARRPPTRPGVGPSAPRPDSGASRNRCVSSGNLRRGNDYVETRRRTVSAATTGSATSTSDSASPVTPRSVAFLATARAVASDQNGEHERDEASFLSFDSGDTDDEGVGNGPDGLAIPGQGDGLFDEDDDPFAKGSVQIVRTKSRAKPAFQLYNPNLIIGPGSAGEPVIVSNAQSQQIHNKVSYTTDTSHDRHHQHGTISDTTSTSFAVPRSRSPQSRRHSKSRTPRPSPSPTPISRMRKKPVDFPLMPGETQEDRKREEENMARNEGIEEWTLCLGRRDVPGGVQSEGEEGEKGTEENIDDIERGEEAEESGPREEERSPEEKRKIVNKASIEGERGRSFAAKRSIPQLRVSHFMESGGETSGEEGYFTGDDWTLQLPLYNVPQDPLLAQDERRIRKSTSHSPAGTSFPEEDRRRATSCTTVTPAITAVRSSMLSLPRSSITVRPSVDELTLHGSGPEPSEPLPPIPSNAATFPIQKDKLTPPSSSSRRVSYCSNGPPDARASMVSVSSLASRTTSSTTTVVPGAWQREQMQQKGECSRSSELGEEEGSGRWGCDDRERRMSACSVRTISTIRSSVEFVARGSSPVDDVRRGAVFGREADIRARTASMGGFRRSSSVGVSPDADVRSRALSPLSREWRDGSMEGERDKNRDSLPAMPGQWLSVSNSREGSLRSVHTGESAKSVKVVRGGNGSVGSILLDDGASGRSGTYYSARSSFSTSG